MDPKQLARILVERGLVEKFVIDQILVKLLHGETLADRLVQESLISEADLLRAVAQVTGTKFISSPRLADLKVSREVLAAIPLEAAQTYDVLPLALNLAQKSLTLVIADPSRLSKLDDLPTVGKMDHVIANVALPSAIRNAIRRLHGLDRQEPAPPSPVGKCSQCATAYFDDQLECAECGLLLNPNAPRDSSEARIVRALLSQPSGLHKMPSRAQVHDGVTRLGFVIQVSDEQIPEVVAGLDIARSLSDFEAFVVSYVDGMGTVGELSQASGLQGIEVRSVVASLAERRVLQLRTPVPLTPEAALPVLVTRPKMVSKTAPAVARPPPPPPAALGRAEPPRPPPPVAVAPPPPPPPEAAKQPPGVPLPRHLNPQVQMENSLQSALALERRGQVDGAISVLRNAIARAPNPAPLYNRLALVILNQRADARQAEELIQKAIKLEPQNKVYRENLIRVLNFAASGGQED